jgi:DNA-binding SARP family transcriptional activator
VSHASSSQRRLTFFGPPLVACADGTPVTFRSRKHLALLVYLAVEQRHSPSRDTLIALLWPEASEEAARNNLRVALADLRCALGEGSFLQTTRHTVRFDPASDHTLDVLVFRELLDASRAHDHAALETCAACLARLEQAAALYTGDFLHGFSLPDSGAFEEWALVQREQLHQAALDALGSLATAAERQGDHATQCRYARRQIELEPWREQAHAQLMRGLWASGQRGDAHAALRFVTALRSFWYTRGHYDEGRRRTLAVLAMPAAQERTLARAGTLNAAAALLWVGGDAIAALPLLDEALAIARAHTDPLNTGWALLHQGMIAYRRGDHAAARPLLAEGIADCRAAGPAGQRGVGWGLIFLGDLALDAGELEQARARFAESVELLRELSDHGLLAYPLRRLAHLALQDGDFAAARALCTESLRLNQAIDDRLAVVACLAAYASVAAAEGQQADGARRTERLRQTARLCGAIAAQLEAIGAVLWPADADAAERLERTLREQLGDAAFGEAWTAGRAMTIDQLLDEASGTSATLPLLHAPAPHNLPTPLTPCIGRDAELSELIRLVKTSDARLLTLVGVGGIGKTHLALEFGRSRLHDLADGVFFVPLAPLGAAAAIAPAILTALGSAAATGDPRQTVVQTLRAKHLLLILDNFEHLLDGASIVTEILQSAPQVEIVVTSRAKPTLRPGSRMRCFGLAW